MNAVNGICFRIGKSVNVQNIGRISVLEDLTYAILPFPQPCHIPPLVHIA